MIERKEEEIAGPQARGTRVWLFEDDVRIILERWSLYMERDWETVGGTPTAF